ncbi:hypothetical protein DFA_01896 [Cavenderia fasciculata]|uniref:N-acetyltransferase domain-containing protein n=1 Tax=Cavenderia fasciculata TaxID=261658 RepID=F4PQP9_CACFS|nr:uncharacterized protein DFA_01896 [Cavenderia fasciculata]EGG22007.1 hypothetical protein DFA_01896 [Cavenderia fasciculata]|eukprot:XP_004359858.1 hypothetical protein DFA_01896 [Cavenderia fasciculata]
METEAEQTCSNQTNDNIVISDDKQLVDVQLVHDYLCNHSYWAKDILYSVVQTSIDNSYCIGAYVNNNNNVNGNDEKKLKQIGFARLITDYSTFGWLADVFVLPEYRGKGVSKLMVEHLLAQKWTDYMRRIMLSTSDAHGLYSRYGFQHIPTNAPTLPMAILKLNAHQLQLQDLKIKQQQQLEQEQEIKEKI